MTTKNYLQERDQKVIWHPFTQHGLESEFPAIVAAKGAYLELADGQRILDAISSWYVNLHGHAHPAIAQAIYTQAQHLDQVMFAGFTHEPAVRLAETLIEAVQNRGTTLSRCFYADNGAAAVEIAMKMAFQYHKNRGNTTRTRFLSLANAYHGDTIGAMSVSDQHGFAETFQELFFPVDFIEPDDTHALEKCLQEKAEQYAGFVLEPMVQAVGGMRIHSAEFVRNVAALCKKHGLLLICDEIFTNFYRTGRCFAFEYAGIQPDLLCLGKGLTGGFLPLSAVLATEAIFTTYHSQDIRKAFLHGHSFTANPVACAAGLASWQILQQPETQEAIQRISAQTRDWVNRLALHPRCRKAYSLGTIGAIEIDGFPNYFANVGPKIRAYTLARQVLLRPLGPVLYAIPPYCTTAAEIDKIYGVMASLLDDAHLIFNEKSAPLCVDAGV